MQVSRLLKTIITFHWLALVGGFDGSSYLKSVEWLDEKNKQWKLAGSMSYRRLGCGVGVVWTTRPS